MVSNVSTEYAVAEKRFLAAKTDEEKIAAMEEMLKYMPKHKGAENLRANLRTRYKKLREKIESKKGKKFGRPGIKKHELQAVIIGMTQSGKSSLLSCLTNFQPEISSIPFTTKFVNLGMLEHEGIQIQIVDEPAIESDYFDQGIANGADVLIIVITNPKELDKIVPFLKNSTEKKIIIMNKADLLSENEKRRLSAWMQSKKYNFVVVSCKTEEGIPELKEKIFNSFNIIRIYTKEPRKPVSLVPIVMKSGSCVKDVAEKIKSGLSSHIKEARVTGPSGKFPNQKVGPEHMLKDKDIIEFYFN